MRTFTVACLALGLTLQVGCALAPKAVAQRKLKSNSKAAEQYLVARQLECQGKQEQARELYKDLLDKHPGNPEYLHRLAVVCTRLQRYGEATSLYERARQRDPKNVSLLSDMGYSFYLRGDHAEAERLLREAMHLKPSDKRVQSNLALVMGSQGKMDECLDLLQQVGDEANAIAGLAYVHQQRGEFDLAENRYREALELDPNLKEAKVALAELSKNPRHRETGGANTTSAREDSISLAEVPKWATEPAEIQQVAATNESTKALVTTAGFFEESAPSEPALLEEKLEFVEPNHVDNTQPFNDEQQLENDEPSGALPDSEPDDQTFRDDDWTQDRPVTAKPTKFVEPTLPSDIEPTTELLTFRSRKSGPTSLTTKKAKNVDPEFSTPNAIADQIE